MTVVILPSQSWLLTLLQVVFPALIAALSAFGAAWLTNRHNIRARVEERKSELAKLHWQAKREDVKKAVIDVLMATRRFRANIVSFHDLPQADTWEQEFVKFAGVVHEFADRLTVAKLFVDEGGQHCLDKLIALAIQAGSEQGGQLKASMAALDDTIAECTEYFRQFLDRLPSETT